MSRLGHRAGPASTRRTDGKRERRLSGLLALLAMTVVASVVAIGVPSVDAANVPTTPVTVTATPVTGLADGQLLNLNIKTTADYPVYAAEARVCRAGVDYQISTTDLPAIDWQLGGANCPNVPITTSAELTSFNGNTYLQAPTPEGASWPLRVGSGTIEWKDTGNRTQRLTCDSTSPCALVVQVFGGTPTRWTPWVQTLTYRDNDPIAACGGPAKDILSTGASDRMTEAWVSWTLGICKAGSGSQAGAPSRATFSGEGLGVSGFDDKSLDLAYTAVGYDDEIGFLPPADPAKPRRPGVMVPLGLNATVLAVGNGTIGPSGRKEPYRDIKLTLAEAALLISGGAPAMFDALPAIYARNPELKGSGMFNAGTQVQVAAASEAEATSWFWGNHVKSLRPDAWKVPNLGTYGDEAGQLRGADASFARHLRSQP